MAYGTEIFRQHFKDYTDQYVLIGGTACDLLLNEAGMQFRATKDIDMVLVVEALTTDFAKSFWQFIEDGGYKARRNFITSQIGKNIEQYLRNGTVAFPLERIVKEEKRFSGGGRS